MIIAFTGYRQNKLPNKETGYIIPNPTYNYVCQETEKLLLKLKPEKCISGMSTGYDQFAAFVCIQLGIPFIAAIPHIGQEKIWPQKSQDQYNWLLKKASEIVVVSEGGYAAYKMQVRNEWMVNNCDEVIACIRSNETNGGTFNCVKYAEQQNKPIHRIDPNI